MCLNYFTLSVNTLTTCTSPQSDAIPEASRRPLSPRAWRWSRRASVLLRLCRCCEIQPVMQGIVPEKELLAILTRHLDHPWQPNHDLTFPHSHFNHDVDSKVEYCDDRNHLFGPYALASCAQRDRRGLDRPYHQGRRPGCHHA